MNMYQWIGFDNPLYLLVHLLEGPVSERKLRLFVVACCRRIEHLMEDSGDQHAVEVAEAFADRRATQRELNAARAAGWWARHFPGPVPPVPFRFTDDQSQTIAWNVGKAVVICADDGTERRWHEGTVSAGNAAAKAAGRKWIETWFVERSRQADLLRCIFGNPFQPTVPDPAWRTPSVMAVAQVIYDERRFGDLPILGDALEEAGCTNREILDHCRTKGEHARGCWVVDCLLGRS
jgi:hypothetical protein